MNALLVFSNILCSSICEQLGGLSIGIIASFIVWYITSIRSSPKFQIENVERDSKGIPYIKVRNISKLDAYKVSVYIMYYNEKKELFHTKLIKHRVIKSKQVCWLNLKINNTEVVNSDIDLSIYVMAQNKLGVGTVKYSERKITEISISDHVMK